MTGDAYGTDTPADDRHGWYLEDLAHGMSASFGKTITEADLAMFAGASGDTNPLHLDESFASRTMAKERIAHGMLTASLISTIVGTLLPGPGSVWVSQSLYFRAPVRIGDSVLARAEIVEVMADKQRIRMATVCRVGNTVVLDGEAVLKVPRRTDA